MVSSTAMLATTGTNRWAVSVRSTAAFTWITSPTNPRSGALCLRASSNPPSTPDSPTAGTPPVTSEATTSVLSLPARTIVATSSVSASVTRIPSTNVVSIPSRSDTWVTCGPPPCTTTAVIPALCSRATSSAKEAASPTVSIAAPPYFTTITLPWCSRMNGSASSSVRAFATVRSRICGGRSKDLPGVCTAFWAVWASAITSCTPR